MTAEVKEELVSRLVRAQALDLESIWVDGWEICLKDDTIYAVGADTSIFKLGHSGDLLKSWFHGFISPNISLAILELDYNELPFESIDEGLFDISFKSLLVSLKDKYRFCLLLYNFKSLSNLDYLLYLNLELVYLRDTEKLSNGFVADSIHYFIAPNLKTLEDALYDIKPIDYSYLYLPRLENTEYEHSNLIYKPRSILVTNHVYLLNKLNCLGNCQSVYLNKLPKGYLTNYFDILDYKGVISYNYFNSRCDWFIQKYDAVLSEEVQQNMKRCYKYKTHIRSIKDDKASIHWQLKVMSDKLLHRGFIYK